MHLNNRSGSFFQHPTRDPPTNSIRRPMHSEGKFHLKACSTTITFRRITAQRNRLFSPCTNQMRIFRTNRQLQQTCLSPNSPRSIMIRARVSSKSDRAPQKIVYIPPATMLAECLHYRVPFITISIIIEHTVGGPVASAAHATRLLSIAALGSITCCYHQHFRPGPPVIDGNAF